MFHHHQRSVFPLVLGLLTLCLAGFVAWSFRDRPQAPPSATDASTPAVTEDDYRGKVTPIVREYKSANAEAGTDLERLLVAERALDALLALRVPAGYKEFHLDLVVSLNQIRNGLRGDAGALSEGRDRFDRTLASAPWLQ